MAPSGPPAAKAKPEAKAGEKKKKVEKKEEPEESKIPAVEQPDKKEFDDKLVQLQTKIDKAQGELKEIKAKTEGHSSGNAEFNAGKSELFEKIRAEGLKIDEWMAKKEEIRGQMGLKNTEEKKIASEHKVLGKKIGYTDLGKIQEREKVIHDLMNHSTLTINEEKAYMKELQQLTKTKPQVQAYAKMGEQVEVTRELNKGNSSLKEQLTDINANINTHREEKKRLNEEFTLLKKERDDKMGNNHELYSARDTLNEAVKLLIQERNELRDGFRQQEKNFYEYQKELKNLRWEKQREERDVKEKEWQQEKRKREAEKLDDQPFVQETTLLEQTIKFCKTFQPKEVEKKEETKVAVVEAKEGEMVLVDKKNRDEEFYYAPTKKGKVSKSKGKKGEGSTKPIKHNAETFKLFASLKIDAPITTDDIPATLEKLEAEMESYKVKITEWEAKRDEMKAQILEKGYVDKEEEEKPDEEVEKETEKEKEEE